MGYEKGRKLNRDLIRQTYENALDHTARLTTYALADGLPDADDEVAERCKRLAEHDLLSLSISLRRVTNATGLYAKAQNLPISTLKLSTDSGQPIRDAQTSLWKILGVIVHVEMVRIFDEKLFLAMWLSPDPFGVVAASAREKSIRIDPICYVKSDHSSASFFVRELAWRASELLAAVRKASEAQGLHLESWMD